MSRRPRVHAVVPTIGASPHLERCLDALLAQQGVELSVVLVEQRRAGAAIPAAVRRLATRGCGFAAAANAGLATAADTPLVALVNDDAVVGAGWLEALCTALLDDPTLGSVQGTNLLGFGPDAPSRSRTLDGVGIAFNRWWQAVQIGHRAQARRLLASVVPGGASEGPREVLGVSATAAIYRREPLERRAEEPGPPTAFDERLESYYEDVDLACRLRAAGLRAAWVPEVTVEHAGSASAGATTGAPRRRLVVRNRLLVLARLLGRRLPAALPRILVRDVVDGWRGGARGLASAAAAWGGALRRLAGFAHAGPPRVPLATLRALSAERATAELLGIGGRPGESGGAR